MKIKRGVSVAAAMLHNIEKALASEMPDASKHKLAALRWRMAGCIIANERLSYD
jgi:hypothetical protein